MKKNFHTPDRWMVLIVGIISLIGILMVYDASVVIAIRDFDDQYHFVREQLRWLIMGVGLSILFSFIDYHRWYKLALPLLIGVSFLLILVFIPGIGLGVLGAHRWLRFGFFVIQPSEFAKLVLILYLSAWFSFRESGRLFAFFLLLGMVVGLVVAEPDLGTAIVLFCTALVLYFLSGAPLVQFLVLIPIFLLGVGGLAMIAPYRLRRLTTFLHPESDPLGASYQIRQALLALGSGGWLGIGIGKSRQKYEYLPEANTDAIVAILGEEIGFVGVFFLIMLYLLFLWRGFRVAKRAPDMFGRLTALGISSWIGIQTALNLAAMVALVPLTGVPLPFISYGGSSLLVLFIAFGIMINIDKQRV